MKCCTVHVFNLNVKKSEVSSIFLYSIGRVSSAPAAPFIDDGMVGEDLLQECLLNVVCCTYLT